MNSIKEQLDEFLKKHPSHKQSLLDVYKGKENKAKKELNKNKEVFHRIRLQIKSEIDNIFFEFDTANLHSPLNHKFKYRLEALDKNHSDLKLLEKSLKPPRPSERDQYCEEFMKTTKTN